MLPADADFLAFKEQLERGPEPLPSAEAQLEKQEAEARERQAAGEHDGSRGAVQAKLCSWCGSADRQAAAGSTTCVPVQESAISSEQYFDQSSL